MKIQMTKEFETLYDWLENKNANVIISGSAGTGKSTFIKWYKENTSKKILFFSPTGIAALNIGGTTIHSFFRLPFKPLAPQDIQQLKEEKKQILKQADIIVIDEMSMLKPDIFDAMSWTIQLSLATTKPFGGKQVILIGDMFQLPPVVTKEVEKFYRIVYKSPFFFDSRVYQKMHFKFCNLTHIFRQSDQEFIGHLNEVRFANPTAHTLPYFNARAVLCDDPDILTLTSYVKTAESINESKMKQNPNEPFTFYAFVQGNFNVKQMLTPEELTLKVGAKVMFTRNDKANRFRNGSFGIIKRFNNGSITVAIENGITTDIKREKWIAYDYIWNEKTNAFEEKEKGSFEQYPLILGYAITIHKSQGQTYSKAKIDLGSGAFAPGQLYVALSRCTDYEQVYLAHPIKPSDIKQDKSIIDWYEKNLVALTQ